VILGQTWKLKISSGNCGGSAFLTNRLSSYKEYAYTVISSWGLIYPLSEHVDIFPVRPVSTFPLLFSVYLILTIYLTWSSFILSGGIKDKGWILFLLSIKIHYIFISDMERSTIVIQLILWLSLRVRVVKWYGVQVIKAWLSFISYLRACSFAELCLDSAPRCPDSPGT